MFWISGSSSWLDLHNIWKHLQRSRRISVQLHSALQQFRWRHCTRISRLCLRNHISTVWKTLSFLPWGLTVAVYSTLRLRQLRLIRLLAWVLDSNPNSTQFLLTEISAGCHYLVWRISDYALETWPVICQVVWGGWDIQLLFTVPHQDLKKPEINNIYWLI